MKRTFWISGILVSIFAIGLMAAGVGLGRTFPDPPTQPLAPAGSKAVTTVLAGGCFWGMQGVFEHVKGVTNTTVGYAGGEKRTAEYEIVSTGKTGHAESLQLTYDPSVITYGQLLKIYFSVAHDPTTLNRQHYDEGTQYRSEIFYTADDQKAEAEKYIKILNDAKAFHDPIVTKIEPLKAFYTAEAYHQHYLDLNPTQPYIVSMDLPLIESLKSTYPEMYKK